MSEVFENFEYMTIKDRLKLVKDIKNKLISVGLPYKNILGCLTPDDLLKYIGVVDLLGKGAFGKVYKACTHNEKELFNNEFKCQKNSLYFAIKKARINQNAFDNILEGDYKNNVYTHEIYILKLLKRLLNKKICPNFPLFIMDFVCLKCRVDYKGRQIENPCINFILELGTGNLSDLFRKNMSKIEFYSYFFQIMAGIHTYQKHFQMVHRDIKPANILYYKIKSGGYFTYVINGKNYYVPNFGYIIIINDFGISHIYNPKDKIFNRKNFNYRLLGSRFAMIMNGKFSPIESTRSYFLNEVFSELGDQPPGPRTQNLLETNPLKINWYNELFDIKNQKPFFPINNIHTVDFIAPGFISTGSNFVISRKNKIPNCGVKLTQKQINFLKNNDISSNPMSKDFFSNSDVIPPFEFYDDVQDCIRMIIGGIRTNRGSFPRIKTIPESYTKELEKFVGMVPGMLSHPEIRYKYNKYDFFSLNPSQVLANYFIKEFYKDKKVFLNRPVNNKELAVYNIS